MRLLIKLFLLFISSVVYSQGVNNDVVVQFNADTLSLDASKVITAALRLKNNLNSASSVEIKINSSTNSVKINGTDYKKIELKPFEQLFIPITAVYKNDKFEEFSLTVNTIINNTSSSVSTLIVKPPVLKNVILNLPQKRIDYNKTDANITIPLSVKNTGTTDELLHVTVKWPEKFKAKSAQQITFNLAAGKDTIFYVTREISEKQTNFDPSRAIVTLFYSDYNFIKSEEVLLSSILNKHKFIKSENSSGTNRIGISSQYVSYIDDVNHRLFIEREVEISRDAKIAINSTAEYLNANNKFYLRNTHVRYSEKDFGVTAGSIFQSGEIAVNGRGLTADFVVNDSVKLSGGIIDKTFNLTDSFDHSRGKSFWLNLLPNKAKTTSTTFYFDREKYSGVDKYILFHTNPIKNTTNFKLNYQHGLSMLSSRDRIPLPGLLVALNSFYQLDKFTWTGTHQASTPYYAGMRRGVVLLQQKVSFRQQKNLLELGYNYYKHQPKSINNLEFFGMTSTNRNLSFAYRFNSNRWIFGSDVSFYSESQFFSYYKSSQELQGSRANIQIQHRFHDLDLVLGNNTSAGIINNKSIVLNTPYNYKTELQLEYKTIRLSAAYQYNYHNVYETFMNNKSEVFQSFAFNTSGNHQIYQDKLKLTWGLSYSRNPQYEGFQTNLNLNYNILNKWDLFAVFYNSESMLPISNKFYQIEAGITRKFNTVKLHEKRHNIVVQVFYNTGNSEFVPAEARKIYINDYVLLTNDKGFATLTKVPTDSYVIRTDADESWLSHQEKLFSDKDLQYKIVLNKTTTIKGTVKWSFEKNPYEIDKATTIFIVTATDINGVVYKTIVDPNDQYTLFLPEGDYKLSISPQISSQLFDIINKDTYVKTSQEPVFNNFSVHVKTRETETKRFSPVKF